ncbi:MAG: ABC transporter ATP-binding protein [Caloramator sp.]|nr:ABC transporter ATP-binding protein [Caloramator sp.]
MISIEGLYKRFEELEALKNINLTIKKGSIFGLIGSNGAGKTTLLKIISGIYKQDKGVLKINNNEVFENVDLKSNIFFVLDNPYFYYNFSLKDMARFYKGIYPNWDDKKFKNLSLVFNLDLNKKLNKLSKGMQKQAALHLALSTNPEVLILDEPLDGLDAVMRQKVKNIIIQEVAEREMTVIISSHNLRELEDFCDHVAILHNGEVILQRDIDELKADIHKVQVVFKKDVNIDYIEGLNILHFEERGSIKSYIIKGKKEDIENKLLWYEPLVLDLLPLTLEEIFIYEMGVVGYEVKNIVV